MSSGSDRTGTDGAEAAGRPLGLTDPAAWKRCGVSPERGFLPDPDPATTLPPSLGAWDALALELPRRLLSGTLQRALAALPELDVAALDDDRALRRAMLVLSYLGHGWVWGQSPPRDRIPGILARPWCEVAARLGRPPVLSYASYALDNWRRLDPQGPIALDNIALLQNFLGGADEDWFIGVHIAIESEAAPLLRAIPGAQSAVDAGDTPALEAALATVAETLERVVGILARMPEHCDPYVYYRRVRPYIHGWKDHPRLPHGVVYEGVEALGDRPLALRGETGAQSALIPTVDALLRVSHAEDPLRVYLREMRDYMPTGHQEFLEAVESGPDVRAYVCESDTPSLTEVYDGCLHWLEQFRSLHLEYAARYIHSQSQHDASNPTAVGTGGTPFMPYLAKHREETARHRRS